jgi:choloylglycine hydrolase
VHYIVNDSAGNCIVIEYVGGKLNIYDNPLGVITNSPGFDWQMTNLRNYVNMSFINSPPVQLGTYKIESFGQGSGMLGIPGDFTPPSRFVRAVAYSQGVGAYPLQTGNDAVLQAFKVLNNFDIPKGSVREGQKDANGNIIADYTLWTSVNDLKSKTYYIRTYDNSQIRSAELMKMNLDGKEIVKLSLQGNEVIKSLLQ